MQKRHLQKRLTQRAATRKGAYSNGNNMRNKRRTSRIINTAHMERDVGGGNKMYNLWRLESSIPPTYPEYVQHVMAVVDNAHSLLGRVHGDSPGLRRIKLSRAAEGLALHAGACGHGEDADCGARELGDVEHAVRDAQPVGLAQPRADVAQPRAALARVTK